MRAAVTGGAGFIGSHVVDALVARGDEVYVVDNFATGRRENLNEAATLYELDIREPLAGLFEEIQPELVVHLAAQADVGTSVERPLFDAEVNVVGTLNVLEAARPHGAQLVFSSTGGAIYGECERPRARRTSVGRSRPTGRRSSRPRSTSRPGTACTGPVTSRSASRTSTGRGSWRSSRAASSRSSWTGSAPAKA